MREQEAIGPQDIEQSSLRLLISIYGVKCQ